MYYVLCISDHSGITFIFNSVKPKPIKYKKITRAIDEIDIKEFKKDISEFNYETEDVTVLDETFNSHLKTILDDHAPEHEKI